MRRVILLSAFYFLLGLTLANAAGVRNFDIPADAAGPGIRLLVWTPCAESQPSNFSISWGLQLTPSEYLLVRRF